MGGGSPKGSSFGVSVSRRDTDTPKNPDPEPSKTSDDSAMMESMIAPSDYANDDLPSGSKHESDTSRPDEDTQSSKQTFHDKHSHGLQYGQLDTGAPDSTTSSHKGSTSVSSATFGSNNHGLQLGQHVSGSQLTAGASVFKSNATFSGNNGGVQIGQSNVGSGAPTEKTANHILDRFTPREGDGGRSSPSPSSSSTSSNDNVQRPQTSTSHDGPANVSHATSTGDDTQELQFGQDYAGVWGLNKTMPRHAANTEHTTFGSNNTGQQYTVFNSDQSPLNFGIGGIGNGSHAKHSAPGDDSTDSYTPSNRHTGHEKVESAQPQLPSPENDANTTPH